MVQSRCGERTSIVAFILVALLLYPSFNTASPVYALRAQSSGSAPANWTCEQAVNSAAKLNAFDLFAGVESCGADGRVEDVSYLLIVGQIRFATDVAILLAAEEQDKQRSSVLYYDVFYKYGGMGHTKVLADSLAVARIRARILDTRIVYKSIYDPGWAYLPISAVQFYDLVAENQKRRRLWQFTIAALYMANDDYRKASLRSEALQRKVGAFQYGTPEADEFHRLQTFMSDISKSIKMPRPPLDTTPYEQIAAAQNKADLTAIEGSNSGIKQLSSGLSGPNQQVRDLFFDALDVRRSWVSQAISPTQLDKLLSSVDFKKQVLLAHAFGEIKNASGRILVTEFEYDGKMPGYRYSVKLGIQNEDCPEPARAKANKQPTQPFVLAVTNAGMLTNGSVNLKAKISSYFHSNFPEGCL